MMNARLILYLSLILGCLATARGEVHSAKTVEWLTCQADVVAVGKIASVKSVKGPGDVVYEDIVLAVSEAIRGVSVKELTFCYRHFSGERADRNGWMNSKGELLVFLSIPKAPYDERRIHLDTRPYYGTRLDGLLVPTNDCYPRSIIDLSAPERFVFDGHLNQLTTRDAILGSTRFADIALLSRLTTDSSFKATPRSVELPFRSPAWKILFGGSTCYLVVPEFMFPESKK